MLIYLSKKIKNAISIRIARLGDNKTVCSCLTMRKLNRSLVTIIWHIVYWYRYQRLNVWTLGSTFQLACSMGAKYFRKAMISFNLSFTYVVEQRRPGFSSDIGVLIFSGVDVQVRVWWNKEAWPNRINQVS